MWCSKSSLYNFTETSTHTIEQKIAQNRLQFHWWHDTEQAKNCSISFAILRLMIYSERGHTYRVSVNSSVFSTWSPVSGVNFTLSVTSISRASVFVFYLPDYWYFSVRVFASKYLLDSCSSDLTFSCSFCTWRSISIPTNIDALLLVFLLLWIDALCF